MALILPTNPFRKPGTGAPVNVPAKSPGAPVLPKVSPAPIQTGNVSQSQITNPRAASPVSTTVANNISSFITTETMTLASANVTGSSWDLQVTSDVTKIILGLTGTYSSGASVKGSIQTTTGLALVTVYKNGSPVIQVANVHLHPLYERLSKWTDDFTDTAKTVAASQTKTALNSATVEIPCSLPADGSKYMIQIQYSPYSGLGAYASNNGPTVTAATGVTAASITNAISVIYGDSIGGQTSHYVYTGFSVNTGINTVQQFMPVQNQSVQDVYLYNFAADSDLESLVITVNGQAVVPYEQESALAARNSNQIQATRPTGAFWVLPNSQIAFNNSSQFQVFLSSGASTTTIDALLYYLA